MSCHHLIEGRTSPAVTAEELIELRRNGTLRDDSLVWESGMSEWVPFESWLAQRARPAAMPPVPSRRTEPARQPEPEPVLAAAAATSEPRMVRCGACGQTWAEALTDGVTCKSCLSKGVQAQKEKDNLSNAEFRVKSDNRYYYLLFAVSLLAALTYLFVFRSSGRRFLFNSLREPASNARVAQTGPPAPGFSPAVASASAIPAPRDLAPSRWRSKDFDKWPRLTFINKAEFKMTEFGYPASSVFVVRLGKAQFVGVTAGTPIRGADALQGAAFPGVPPADVAIFHGFWKPPGWNVGQTNRELTNWGAHLGQQDPALRFPKLSEKGGDAMAALVLELNAPKDWPCSPLEARRTPLVKDEELAIVYADRFSTGHRQYLAQARTVAGGDQFAPIGFAAPVERYEGMLGGVAIDKDGRFAGTVVAVLGGLQDGKVTQVLLECSMRTAAKAEWPAAK